MGVRNRTAKLRARDSLGIAAASLAMIVAPVATRGAAAQAPPCSSGVTCTGSGGDAAKLQGFVDGTISPVVRGNAVGGAVVGVSWNGRRSFFGYGVGGTPAFKPDTIVEIGSITKVFTTALFAEAVGAHETGLADPLASYASALGVTMGDPCSQQVTLEQVANFSSGMPRMPSLPDGKPLPRFPDDDIEHYKPQAFLDWLSAWSSDSSRCDLQGSYLYSNAGIGVLGYLVADVHYKDRKHDWSRLVHEEVLDPLRMTSTFLAVPQADEGRLAKGYDGAGSEAPAWPTFAWYPAGGLRSDAADMLAFGEAALQHEAVNGAPVPTRLTTALQLAMTTLTKETSKDGDQTVDQGLAWVQTSAPGGVTLYQKNGGTAGFESVIVIDPGEHLAVFVAFSKEGSPATRLGIDLAERIPARMR